MKIGIDSYCFHRFFGEVYEDHGPNRRQSPRGSRAWALCSLQPKCAVTRRPLVEVRACTAGPAPGTAKPRA